MGGRKRVTSYVEGPEAEWRFEHGMNRILRVSKGELEKREAEYQESRKNKSRPGPKKRS